MSKSRLGFLLGFAQLLLVLPLSIGSVFAHLNFSVHLSGDQVSPAPIDTRGTGQAIFQFDPDSSTVSFQVNVSNLSRVTSARLHLGFPGENGPPVATLFEGLTGPRTNGVLTKGALSAADLEGELAGAPMIELVLAMRSGGVYVQIATQAHPGGEIRGNFKAPPPVTLEQLSPASSKLGDFPPLLTTSGWPLTLKLTANNLLGIGVSEVPPQFPISGRTGYLVFEDPDGCFSFSTDCDTPFDETIVEFTPDLDVRGVADSAGNPEIQIVLADQVRPTVPSFNFELRDNSGFSEVGPRLAAFGFPDGYGYGPDDDLPGLFLLSDTGVGLVFDDFFNWTGEARNLAGFFNSVSYELSDANFQTTILAHMVAPADLFTPLVLVDREVDDHDGSLVRIDGGPITEMVNFNNLGPAVADRVTTIRAFVVNGPAGETLPDLDGNGIVDVNDAILAGYDVISNEVQFQVMFLYDITEFFGVDFDFDGNGAVGSVVLPAGPGGISPLPR